ncbi:phosphatidate cytidylyltransferase [Atopobacter phocae]|uniref:phosphatidate cytidylyltransferase n=1 Tax=Atopobacter phocae TaxID=136492 RepID=UPI000471D264|nr:phosphatidate cytidylyltransferase [Atopobacter phocae]
MKVRVISALIALLIFIPTLMAGGHYLALMMMVLSAIAMRELITMSKNSWLTIEGWIAMIATVILVGGDYWVSQMNLIPGVKIIDMLYIAAILLLSLTVFNHHRFHFNEAAIYILGALYIGTGFNSVLMLRAINFQTILGLFIIIWSTDSFAYLVGRQFGRHKLAPHVSPNKTIEGSVGGTIIAVALFTLFNHFYPVLPFSLPIVMMGAFFISIASQLGDLVESSYKRYYDVKDSGQFLPGHGGVLDRFDSFLFASVIMRFILSFVL